MCRLEELLADKKAIYDFLKRYNITLHYKQLQITFTLFNTFMIWYITTKPFWMHSIYYVLIVIHICLHIMISHDHHRTDWERWTYTIIQGQANNYPLWQDLCITVCNSLKNTDCNIVNHNNAIHKFVYMTLPCKQRGNSNQLDVRNVTQMSMMCTFCACMFLNASGAYDIKIAA